MRIARWTAPLLLAVLLALLLSSTADAGAFAIGPPSLEVTVPSDGEADVSVYITSDFDGELLVDTEGVPFDVEPKVIEIEDSYVQQHVDLTFVGKPSASAGTYDGKVTFLGYMGGNVAGGVKLELTATVTGTGGVASIDETGGWLEENYLIVVLGGLAVVALVFGILIGRRGRPRPQPALARKRRREYPQSKSRTTR